MDFGGGTTDAVGAGWARNMSSGVRDTFQGASAGAFIREQMGWKSGSRGFTWGRRTIGASPSLAMDVAYLKGEFNSRIVKRFKGREFHQYLAKHMQSFFRHITRQEGRHTLFDQIARSITVSVQKSGDGVRLTMNTKHRAAAMKEYGGEIVAGQGPYSKGSGKYRKRPGGKATFIPIPAGHVRGSRPDRVSNYGKLTYIPPHGGTGVKANYGGALFDQRSGRVVFRLYRRIEIPPHQRKRGGGTGWMPQPEETHIALRQAVIAFARSKGLA